MPALHKILAIITLLTFSSAAQATYVETPKEEPKAAVTPPALAYPLVGDYMAGGYALRHSDHDDAAKIFLSSLAKDPENPLMLKNSYNAMLSLGKVSQAVELAKKYSRYDATDPALNILLAAYAMNNKQFASAEALLNNAAKKENMSIASNVGMVIIPFLKFWAMAGEKKFDDITLYQQSILEKKKFGPSLFMYYQNALIDDIKGDNAKAESEYAHLVEPGSVMPYHFARVAGNFYERMGKTEKAKAIYESFQMQPPQLGHFRESLKNIENGKAITEKTVPNAAYGFNEVLKEGVRILFSSGFYEEGLSYLRLILFINPNDDEANLLLASYYEQLNDFKKAVDIYKNINPKSDFYITSRIAISDNLFNEGKKRQAVRELIKVLGGEKSSSVVLLTLADIFRKDMKYDLAVSVYNRIIKNIGDSPQEKDWPIFFARGICYERAGDLESSEKDLLTALQLKPGQPEVLNYLGYSWIDKNKNLDQATKMVAIAVKARPNDGQIVDSMGWALFKTNDFNNAAKFLERASELMPYDSVVNDHLGDTYWKQGRFNEARFQWNRVLRYKNSDEIVEKTVRDKLKNGLKVMETSAAHS